MRLHYFRQAFNSHPRISVTTHCPKIKKDSKRNSTDESISLKSAISGDKSIGESNTKFYSMTKTNKFIVPSPYMLPSKDYDYPEIEVFSENGESQHSETPGSRDPVGNFTNASEDFQHNQSEQISTDELFQIEGDLEHNDNGEIFGIRHENPGIEVITERPMENEYSETVRGTVTITGAENLGDDYGEVSQMEKDKFQERDYEFEDGTTNVGISSE